MTRYLFLNELSLVPAGSITDARRRMARVVKTVAAAINAGAERTIRLVEPIHGVVLAAGYTVTQWRHDTQVDFERRQYWNSLREMAPPFDDTDTERPQLTEMLDIDEFVIGDRPAVALSAAGLSGGLGISLASESLWDTHEVIVTHRFLDGTNIREELLSVRHASDHAHVAIHSSWLARPPTPPPQSLAQLWVRRHELFPYLSFCNVVEEQIIEAEARGLFEPTKRRLEQLNDLSKSWTEGSPPLHKGTPGHPRMESEATLNMYEEERTFVCPDGCARVFTWHVSLTDGDRLHFFPIAPQRMIVGYVGKHLNTATG